VTETLTARLHTLEAVFAPLASSYAHPRELEEQRDFAEAVRLLQSPDVLLYTVMQYVTGTNWTLACAALAALIGRADRDDAMDDVVAHFDKLYPWPMYFALKYFTVAEPRPPVGAPAAGAKDWWCENVIIPGFFRDYFAQRDRLGDAPEFGSALQATNASPPGTIKAFLQRVNHAHATALIGLLDNFQRAVDACTSFTINPTWLTTEPIVPPFAGGAGCRRCRLMRTPGNRTNSKSPGFIAVPPIATKIFLLASISLELRCQWPMVTPDSLNG